MSHSPVPWYRHAVPMHGHQLRSSEGEHIATVHGHVDHPLSIGDAEYIVRCVNAHDALVTALKAVIAADDIKSLAGIVVAVRQAREALKLAGDA